MRYLYQDSNGKSIVSRYRYDNKGKLSTDMSNLRAKNKVDTKGKITKAW